MVKTKLRNFEDNVWADNCVNHPGMHIAQECLKNVTQFCCLADNYPDLVSRIHIQIRLMGNFELYCGVSWHVGTNGSHCLICKQDTDDVIHFLLDCPLFKQNVDSVWLSIKARITETNPLNGTQICNFISNLDRDSKVLVLLGACHCHLITRWQFLSKDLCHQQSEKSINCIRINYLSWRLRG